MEDAQGEPQFPLLMSDISNFVQRGTVVVVVAEIPLAIHYLFLIKKSFFNIFFISTQNR